MTPSPFHLHTSVGAGLRPARTSALPERNGRAGLRPAPTFLLLTLACCVITAPGCQQDNAGGNTATPVKPAASAAPKNYTTLRSGSRTFNYMVGPGGTVTVYDTTADKLLLRTQVPPQATVLVSTTEGIFVNNTQLLKGPLPPKNTRELRLDR